MIRIRNKNYIEFAMLTKFIFKNLSGWQKEFFVLAEILKNYYLFSWKSFFIIF